MAEVSVIVPARNAARTLPATLAALSEQEGAEYEVVVVDDNSSDATAALVTEAGSPFRLVRADGRGPGPARNTGVASAEAPLLAFTDADCRPARDWLRRGVEALHDADLVQGAVRPVRGVEARPFDRTIWVTGLVGLFETANLFVRRHLFEELDGFEHPVAARGKPLGEDLWFGWRAERAGARIAFSETAVVEHEVFRRGVAEFVRERGRVAYFPAMVSMVPELRRRFLFARVFLNRRTAAFDAAVAGTVGAVALGTTAPVLLATPYAWILVTSARRWGRQGPRAAAGEFLADALGFGSLVAGSVRAGTPVL